MNKWIKLILFLILLSACSGKVIFQKNHVFKNGSWSFDDPVTFRFEVNDTSVYYDIILDLRLHALYPYSNIWLSYFLIEPSGSFAKKRMEFALATPEGQWIGKGLGDIIDNELLVAEHFKFHQKGTYIFRVNHEMRDDILSHLISMTLVVKKSEEQ